MEKNDSQNHARAAHATFQTREDFSRIQMRKGAYLPHWTAEGAVYHVRYRLHDSLPLSVRERLNEEREMIRQQLRRAVKPLTVHAKRRMQFLFSEKVDRYLDAGHGSCWLKNEKIAQIVSENINYFDGERYRLYSWCVMPNHVHAVVQPLGKYQLPDVVHSWKSYTAKKANKILDRNGKFWQQEYFDRILRDGDKVLSSAIYVFSNPDKAGLANWKWRGRLFICEDLDHARAVYVT